MEILILEVEKVEAQEDPKAEGTPVIFDSAMGRGRGILIGAAPEPKHLYEVEVGVDGVQVWGWDICPEDAQTAEFRAATTPWTVSAILEDIEDDGLATLKVGPRFEDALLVDTDGPSPMPGSKVVAKLGLIRLWVERA